MVLNDFIPTPLKFQTPPHLKIKSIKNNQMKHFGF